MDEIKHDEIDELVLQASLSSKEKKQLDNIVIESIKESEEMEIDNNKVYKVALENKNEMLNIQKALLELNTQQCETNDLFDGFFKKTWKLAISIFFVSLVSGYSIAVFHHNNIKPFVKDIVKEVIKSVVKVES